MSFTENTVSMEHSNRKSVMDDINLVINLILYVGGCLIAVFTMLVFNKYMKMTICPSNTMTPFEVIIASLFSWFTVGSVVMASLLVTVIFIFELVKGKATNSKLAEWLTKEF